MEWDPELIQFIKVLLLGAFVGFLVALPVTSKVIAKTPKESFVEHALQFFFYWVLFTFTFVLVHFIVVTYPILVGTILVILVFSVPATWILRRKHVK